MGVQDTASNMTPVAVDLVRLAEAELCSVSDAFNFTGTLQLALVTAGLPSREATRVAFGVTDVISSLCERRGNVAAALWLRGCGALELRIEARSAKGRCTARALDFMRELLSSVEAELSEDGRWKVEGIYRQIGCVPSCGPGVVGTLAG